MTVEMVKGIFEHQYRLFYEPKPKGGRMLDQRGFNLQQAQSLRPEKVLKRKHVLKD
jgi:hypothetical protein